VDIFRGSYDAYETDLARYVMNALLRVAEIHQWIEGNNRIDIESVWGPFERFGIKIEYLPDGRRSLNLDLTSFFPSESELASMSVTME
jgi:hypothetical protein